MRFTARAKERLQQCSARFGEHTLHDFDAMIERNIVERGRSADDRACTWFARAEHQHCDARVNQRPRAHRARFHRDVQRRAGQAVVSKSQGRGAQRNDFRVRGRVVSTDRLIGAFADNLPLVRDDGTNGHLTFPRGARREMQRASHEGFVIHAHSIGCRMVEGCA